MKKIRVICNGVSFYTSKKAIQERRVGDFSLQNDALSYALEQMALTQELVPRFGTMTTK
jgi:hypothetical protein